MSKFCGCTVEGGAVYRICEKTGVTREVAVANVFGMTDTLAWLGMGALCGALIILALLISI